MVSIIVPAYKDPYLQKTIHSLLSNAKGKIEVIVVLDGYILPAPLTSDSRVKIISFPENLGMRAAINAGISEAHGKFIMKCDSHCVFGSGFDKIMSQHSEENWLMIPRRYSVDELNWQRNEKRPIVDYYYVNIPVVTKFFGTCFCIQDWNQRTKERRDPKYDIDDTMIFQGSCWFAHRKYFMKRVGFLDDRPEAYGPFGGEQLEIGLKYWLGGGEIKVIKKTWYAHLLKRTRHYRAGLFPRDYKLNRDLVHRRAWTMKHWLENEELDVIHPFSWLVEKFWPVPSWPEDRSLWVAPK